MPDELCLVAEILTDEFFEFIDRRLILEMDHEVAKTRLIFVLVARHSTPGFVHIEIGSENLIDVHFAETSEPEIEAQLTEPGDFDLQQLGIPG